MATATLSLSGHCWAKLNRASALLGEAWPCPDNAQHRPFNARRGSATLSIARAPPNLAKHRFALQSTAKALLINALAMLSHAKAMLKH